MKFESVAGMKKIYENIPIPYVVIDYEGRIAEVNSNCLKLLSYSYKEFVGQLITEFVAALDLNKLKQWIERGVSSGAFSGIDIQFISKSGQLLFLRANGVVNQDARQINCTFVDVTEQKQVEDALKSSELKFRGLLESTPDAMVVVDSKGKIIHINNQTVRHFGYTIDELLGQNIEILIPTRFHGHHVGLRNGYMRNPHPRQMGAGIELSGRRKDQTEFPVEISLNYQDIGSEIHILTGIRDITDRIKSEERLRESRERFSSSFEYAAIGMALVSTEGKWLKVNQSVCNIVGYPKDELMSMTFQDITHPEDLNLDLEYLHKMLDNEIQTYKIEKRYFHKTGRIVWVLLSVSLVRSKEKKPLYFISQIEDISEWKVTQQALIGSEERFRLAVSGTGMGIWEWNKLTGKAFVSAKFYELLGFENKELELDLAKIFQRINPAHLGQVKRDISKHLLTNETFQIEFQMKKKNGEYTWVAASGQAQFDENNSLVRMLGYLTDISKRKQAEDRFEGLFSSSPDSIVMLGLNKNIIMANNKSGQLFGSDTNQMIGKSIERFIPNFISTLNEKLDERVRMNQEKCINGMTLDLYVFNRNNEQIPVEIALSEMVSDGEQLVVAIIRDVSERQRADAERRRILAALNVTTDGIFMFEYTSLQHIYVNSGATEQIGYTEEELLQMTPLDFKIEYSKESFRALLNPLVNGERSSITIETVHRHKNGQKIQVEIIFQTAKLEEENKVIVAVVRNITERKLAEEALHLSEERFRELYENSTFGIYRTARNGQIILANPALIKLLGFETFEELEERNLEIEGYGSDLSREEFVTKIEVDGKVTDIEAVWIKKDGTRIYVRESAKLIIDKNTGEHFYDGTVEDVSGKKQVELERIARQAAEEANKTKSIFLANMSHEIRTPLNSIIGFSDMLYSSFEGGKAKSQVDSIRNSGRNLLRIINDILDLSKIEAGKMEFQPEPVRFEKLIGELDVMFKQRAQEKDISFFIEIEKKIPAVLRMDETRVRQILFNLLGNAMKFTQRGSVILSVNVVQGKKGEIDLEITVEDTGIGIPEDQLERIFEPFTQQEGQLEKQYGGTGLGLSITQRLVETMGGSITVESQMGKGSIFKTILPGIEIEKDVTEQLEFPNFDPTALSFEKVHILIADDNKENRKLLRDFFDFSNLQITEAVNGKQAVELALKHVPDLILMDLRMPEMNGIEATSMIKSNDATRHIPIVAVSASSRIVFKEQLQLNIFNDFLAKPIDLSELTETLKKYLKYKVREPESKKDHFLELKADLSEEQQSQLPTLVQLLQTKFIPEYKQVLKKQVIDEIENFGRDLIIVGLANSANFLVEFGEEICMFSDNFEIDELMKKLKSFPKLVSSLKRLTTEK